MVRLLQLNVYKLAKYADQAWTRRDIQPHEGSSYPHGTPRHGSAVAGGAGDSGVPSGLWTARVTGIVEQEQKKQADGKGVVQPPAYYRIPTNYMKIKRDLEAQTLLKAQQKCEKRWKQEEKEKEMAERHRLNQLRAAKSLLKKRKNQEEAANNQGSLGGGVGNIFKTIIEGFNANASNNPYRRPQNIRAGNAQGNQADSRYQKIMGPIMNPTEDNHQDGEEAYSGPNLLTTPVVKSRRLLSKQQQQRQQEMKKYMKLFVEAIMDPEFSQSQHVNSIIPNNPFVSINVPTERQPAKAANEESEPEREEGILVTIDLKAVQDQIDKERKESGQMQIQQE